MLIITENNIINTEKVFALSVVARHNSYPEYKKTGYQLRALHSGYVDDNGNADYLLVKEYKLEEKNRADTDLGRIVKAYKNGEKIVDLR